MKRPTFFPFVFKALGCAFLCFSQMPVFGQLPLASGDRRQALLNEPIDLSEDFRNFANTSFLADELVSFDPATGRGMLRWQRGVYKTRQAINNMLAFVREAEGNEFPGGENEVQPVLPFSVEFVTPRPVRLRVMTGTVVDSGEESLMLAQGVPGRDTSWRYSALEGRHRFPYAGGSVVIRKKPWRVEFYKPDGKLISKTNHLSDNNVTYTSVLPFGFVRRSSDYFRSVAAVFSLSPGEKIYGMGEHLKALNKRGQTVVLGGDDANGVMNETMHKPIPFYLSSNGYGLFCIPSDDLLVPLTLWRSGGKFRLSDDPCRGKIRWRVIPAASRIR